MDRITKIGIAALVGLFIAAVAVTGCTVQNPIDQVQQATGTNKALDLTKIQEQNFRNGLGKNETMQDMQVAANGTDGATIQYTSVNKSSSGFMSNGTQTSVALNVHKYATTEEATKVYKSMTFGYIQNNSISNTTLKANEKDAYKEVMGHKATVQKGAMKIVNFSFVSGSIALAIQQDEFILWGTMDFMPASSG